MVRRAWLYDHPAAIGVTFFGLCAVVFGVDLASRHASKLVWWSCVAGTVGGAAVGALIALTFGGRTGARAARGASIAASIFSVVVVIASMLVSPNVKTVGMFAFIGCLAGMATMLRTVRRSPEF